jgi:hypothetical protein
MRRQLGLDETQVRRVTEILHRERERLRKLRQTERLAPMRGAEDRAALAKLRDAQVAGDEQRLREARREVQESLVPVIRKRQSEVRAEIAKIEAGETARGEVRALLREEQLARFDERWREYVAKGAPPEGRAPQAFVEAVRALPDLTPEQRTRVTELVEAYRDSREELSRRLRQDVEGVLTEEQREAVEESVAKGR